MVCSRLNTGGTLTPDLCSTGKVDSWNLLRLWSVMISSCSLAYMPGQFAKILSVSARSFSAGDAWPVCAFLRAHTGFFMGLRQPWAG